MPRHHHDIRHPRGGFGAADMHYQLNARMPNLAQVDELEFDIDDGRHFATIHENFRRTPPRHTTPVNTTPVTLSPAEHTEEDHDHESTSDTHGDHRSLSAAVSVGTNDADVQQRLVNKRPLPGYERFIGFYTQVESSVWGDTEVRLSDKEKVLAKIVGLCGDRIFNKICARRGLPEEIQEVIKRFLGNWMQWDVNLHGCITAPRACNICDGRAAHVRRAEMKDIELARATVQDSNFLPRLDECVKRAASQGMWHARVEFEFKHSSSFVSDEVRHNYDGLLEVSRRKRAVRDCIQFQLRTYGFNMKSMNVTLSRRRSYVIVSWSEGSEEHTDNESNLTSTSGNPPGTQAAGRRQTRVTNRAATAQQAVNSEFELAQRYLERLRNSNSPMPISPESSSIHSSVASSPDPPEYEQTPAENPTPSPGQPGTPTAIELPPATTGSSDPPPTRHLIDQASSRRRI